MATDREEVIQDLVDELGHGSLLLELHPVESLDILVADHWLLHGGPPSDAYGRFLFLSRLLDMLDNSADSFAWQSIHEIAA